MLQNALVSVQRLVEGISKVSGFAFTLHEGICAYRKMEYVFSKAVQSRQS